MKEFVFTCPKCGCNTLVEVMCDVTLISEITKITREDGEVIPDCLYAPLQNDSVDGGHVEYYRCQNCDQIVCDSPEDLFESPFIKERNA